MTKDTLKGFGLTDDQIDQVWKGLDGNYVTKSRFNEVNEEKKRLQESLNERDKQLEALKSESGAAEALKQQIEELQKANAEKENTHAAELKRLKRDALDERLLTESKAINPIAVKPFLAAIDDGIDDEGYVALRQQHIEALTKSDSMKFLFQVDQAGAHTFVGVKPAESGDAKPINSSGVNPFAKDTYDEAAQIKLFRENPELAKALAKQAGLKFL
jgi:hypothetical protein